MGFFDMFRPASKPIANGVTGTAQVVSVSQYTGKGVYQSCHMNLVINAPNVTPTAVEFEGIVHNRQWPAPGSTLPVSVDPSNPRKYAILWGEVPSSRDTSRGHAESIAAALRGEPDSLAQLVGGGMLGNVQVIGDTTHITQEQRDKLKAFGIDIDAVIAAGGASGGGASGVTVVGSSGGLGGFADGSGDTVGKLERLAALRDRGALTEAEFAAEKKKILES